MLVNGNKVNIDWYYSSEDDIIYDSGTIFQSLLELPIELKKIAEKNPVESGVFIFIIV